MASFVVTDTIAFDARQRDYLAGLERHRYALGDQIGAAVRALYPWMPRGNKWLRLLNS